MYLLNPIKVMNLYGFKRGLIFNIITLSVVGMVLFILWNLLMLAEPIWKYAVYSIEQTDPIVIQVQIINKEKKLVPVTTMVKSGAAMIPITNYIAKYLVTAKNVNSQEVMTIRDKSLYKKVKVNDLGKLSYREEYRKYLWQSKEHYKLKERIDYSFN